MSRIKSRSAVLFVLLSPVLLITGCAGDSDPPTGPAQPGPVASVAVLPAQPVIAVGQRYQLTVELHDGAGRPANRPVTWSSAAPQFVTVSATGMVTGIAVGEARITATSEGKQGGVLVRVELPVPGPPAVERVDLNVLASDVAEGSQLRLEATPRDAQGQPIQNLGIVWASSDPGIAEVDPAGSVTGFRAGVAFVTAKVHGRLASAAITVTSNHASDLVFAAWNGIPGEGSDLMLVDPRQSARVPTPLVPEGIKGTNPASSPDGRHVAFVTPDPWAHTDIYLLDRGTGAIKQLTTGSAFDDQPAWSPDGQWIAFRRRLINPDDSPRTLATQVWIMAADGTGGTSLTLDQSGSSTGSPSWSPMLPGGPRIVYSRLAAGASHLWTMAPDGSDKRQVTFGEVYDDQPAWSPDGASIAFVRFGTTTLADIWLTSPAGAGLRKLADLLWNQYQPAWSPDGKLIAFASNHEAGHYEIYTAWTEGALRLARRTADPGDKAGPVWVKR